MGTWDVDLHQIHQVQDWLLSILVQLCLHGQTNRLCLILAQSDVQCLQARQAHNESVMRRGVNNSFSVWALIHLILTRQSCLT